MEGFIPQFAVFISYIFEGNFSYLCLLIIFDFGLIFQQQFLYYIVIDYNLIAVTVLLFLDSGLPLAEHILDFCYSKTPPAIHIYIFSSETVP